MKSLKEELVRVAKDSSVDLVGIAPVERLAGAPAEHRPTDFLPTTRSVVAMAVHVPQEVVSNKARLTFYTLVKATTIALLDRAAYRVACFLEDRGGRALPIPADDPYTSWDTEARHGMGELSHKHVAVAAGLGILGKNTLLVTPKYGNRVHLVSVITDLDIEPDPLCTAALCGPQCRRCLDACPAGAILADGRVVQKLCRERCGTALPRGFEVYSCWECRRVCPQGGGVVNA